MKKKILLIGTLFLFIGSLFTACKPNNDEKLIGTWVIEKAMATQIDSTQTNVTDLFTEYYYQFKYEGALSYAYRNMNENVVDTVRGQWSLHDNELMLTVLDTTHHIQITELSDNTMHWNMKGANKWLPKIHQKDLSIDLKKKEK